MANEPAMNEAFAAEPARWRLLLVTGQSVHVEALHLATTGHGITAKGAHGRILLSLPSRLVLLIQAADQPFDVSDADLMAAWEKTQPPRLQSWRQD
jgi:hypothetical protein